MAHTVRGTRLSAVLDIGAPALDEVQHLVKLGRKEVERRNDSTIGPQLVPSASFQGAPAGGVSLTRTTTAMRRKAATARVLLHHVLVVDRLPDVDVGLVRQVRHGRVQVQNVGHLARGVNVGGQALTIPEFRVGRPHRRQPRGAQSVRV